MATLMRVIALLDVATGHEYLPPRYLPRGGRRDVVVVGPDRPAGRVPLRSSFRPTACTRSVPLLSHHAAAYRKFFHSDVMVAHSPNSRNSASVALLAWTHAEMSFLWSTCRVRKSCRDYIGCSPTRPNRAIHVAL